MKAERKTIELYEICVTLTKEEAECILGELDVHRTSLCAPSIHNLRQYLREMLK